MAHANLAKEVGLLDHTRGPKAAPLEIVEYGDYECPHCGLASIELVKVREVIGDNIRFVYRNFPLTDSHPNAYNAALAAEAAGCQGKFWEMHDLLFLRQKHLSTDDLSAYAKRLGLDVSKFQTAVKMPSSAEKVDQDFESGLASGVGGTPTFFINNKKYEGDWQHGPVIAYLKNLLENLTNRDIL